jgi:hypothetical protein
MVTWSANEFEYIVKRYLRKHPWFIEDKKDSRKSVLLTCEETNFDKQIPTDTKNTSERTSSASGDKGVTIGQTSFADGDRGVTTGLISSADYIIWDPNKWDDKTSRPQAGYCDRETIIKTIVFHLNAGECVSVNLDRFGIMLIYYSAKHKQLRLFPGTVGLRSSDGIFDIDCDVDKMITISNIHKM